MSQIKIIHGDAGQHSIAADLIITDPPFDMPATQLAQILLNQRSDHVVLLTTMRQLLSVYPLLNYALAFDFVLDSVAPKKSRNIHQPNYTHITGAYLTANGAASRFNRKKRQRSDVFENNGYWPTIFHAPRERMADHGMAKNADAFADIIGSFDISSVLDPFAGSGTTGIAAFELGVDCTLIEIEEKNFRTIKERFKFLGA